MRRPRRRLVVGVLLITVFFAAAGMLRVALEWRQALDDIDAMIVTPVVLPSSPPVVLAQSSIATPSPEAAAAQQSADDAANASAQSTTAATPQPTSSPLFRDALNILLLGTDARPGDEIARTDAVVLVRLDNTTGQVSMLSLPRDLWVTYPNAGKGRINAAYAVGEATFGAGGGPALAKATVSNLTGLRIDYFVLINFEGFRTLIDRLDGITVDVPESIRDPAYPTDDYNTISVFFPKGPQQLDGKRALVYVRTRHADSDFGRNQRQQQVLLAIFQRVRERGLLQQLTSLDDYTGALRGYVRTDLSRTEMLEIARWGRGIALTDIQRYAVDADAIVVLRDPATFAAKPRVLRQIVSQFTAGATTPAGGK